MAKKGFTVRKLSEKDIAEMRPVVLESIVISTPPANEVGSDLGEESDGAPEEIVGFSGARELIVEDEKLQRAFLKAEKERKKAERYRLAKEIEERNKEQKKAKSNRLSMNLLESIAVEEAESEAQRIDSNNETIKPIKVKFDELLDAKNAQHGFNVVVVDSEYNVLNTLSQKLINPNLLAFRKSRQTTNETTRSGDVRSKMRRLN